MRNRFVLMMSLLALFGTLCSCSNEDEIDLETVKKAQVCLIGKWRFISDLESDYDVPSTEFVEFCENGTVIFEYGVGTDDYRHEESQFVYENNWGFSEPGIYWAIYGHVQLKNGGPHDEGQRYYCFILDDRLHFGPVGDGDWMSKTSFYIRVQ